MTGRDVLRDRQQWGRRGMVSSGSAEATAAGLQILRDGGNAVDAAVAVSAAMTVTQPMACGPGGDGAAIVHVAGSRRTYSLGALGRAPAGASVEEYRRRGHEHLPRTGPLSVTTPALVDGWLAVHARFGVLPLSAVLEPARHLASDGVVVTGQGQRWTKDNLAVLTQPEFRALYAPIAEHGSEGGVLVQPGLAAFFELVVAHAGSPQALRAELADAVLDAPALADSLLTREDLVLDDASLTPTTTVQIGRHVVHTNGAPTQGPLLAANLALYDRLAGDARSDSAEGIHLLAEAVNQTYGWRLDNLGDPDAPASEVVGDLLDADVLAGLASEVDPVRRSPSRCLGRYSEGDTTHFVVADDRGNSVSWTQSLGLGFGAGVGVPALGLFLCNRLGRSATLTAGDPNCAAPGRRPVNTILAWLATDAAGVTHAGGTPGGDGQTQWNAQVLLGLLRDRDSLVQVLNRPRWTYYPGSDKVEAGMVPQLRVDAHLDETIAEDLRGRGHDVVPKASVGGVVRAVERGRSLLGLDEGRHEGLTAGC